MHSMATVKRSTAMWALLLLAAFFGSLWIGARDIDVGADSASYARSYMKTAACLCLGGHEPGFVTIGILAGVVGLSVAQYFAIVSLLSFILTFKIIETSVSQVGIEPGKIKYVIAVIGFLGLMLANPLYTQVHINALRHGISALLICLAVLQVVDGRRWYSLVFLVLSSLFHYSALLYIPLVILGAMPLKRGFLVTFIALTLFCGFYLTGISKSLIEVGAPKIYSFVMDYGDSAANRYDAGVRWDFAIFSYVLSLAGLLLAHGKGVSPRARKISEITALCCLPFFVLGWGVFSNRYLFTPWILLSVLAGHLLTGWYAAKAVPGILMALLLAVGLGVFIVGAG